MERYLGHITTAASHRPVGDEVVFTEDGQSTVAVVFFSPPGGVGGGHIGNTDPLEGLVVTVRLCFGQFIIYSN